MNHPFSAVRSQAGFSLIEVMVAVAVLAILAVVAAPQMQNQIAGSRVTAATNDFLGELARARSDAIRFNRQEPAVFPAAPAGVNINAGMAVVRFMPNGTTADVGQISLANDARTRCIRVIGSGKAFLEDCP